MEISEKSIEDINQYVRFRIILLRKLNRLTQVDIAERAKISLRNYQRLEAGHSSLKLDAFIAISKALEVKPESFFLTYTHEDFSGFHEIQPEKHFQDHKYVNRNNLDLNNSLCEFYNTAWNEEQFSIKSETVFKELPIVILIDELILTNKIQRELTTVDFSESTKHDQYQQQRDTEVYWYYVFFKKPKTFYFDTSIISGSSKVNVRCFVKIERKEDISFTIASAFVPL